MKQILTTIVAIVASLNVVYGYDFKYNDLYYTIISNEDRTVSVSAYSYYSIDHSNSKLVELTIPQRVSNEGTIYTVTEVGSFRNSQKLTSVSIPSSVTSIGDYAFYDCTRLTEVTIPNSVTSIGYRAFRNCTGLTEVTIPNSVTSIGDEAFYGCTGLTSVSIPSSVTSIGDYAFRNCTGLTEMSIPSSVTTIGKYAFADCTGLTEVSIPSSVTSIGDYSFYGCTGLTSVTIPSSVTTIGNYAFYDCTGLTEVTIPSSVTSIGDSAFSDCTGLTSVTIPSSVTTIGNCAFSGCTGLTSVTCMWNEPITTTENVFSDATYNCPLYVPVGTRDKYDNAVPWYRFSQIIEKDMSGVDDINLSQEAEVKVVDGAIYVSGDEPVRIVAMNGATVYSGRGDCSVNVAKGIYIVIVNGKSHKVVV